MDTQNITISRHHDIPELDNDFLEAAALYFSVDINDLNSNLVFTFEFLEFIKEYFNDDCEHELKDKNKLVNTIEKLANEDIQVFISL